MTGDTTDVGAPPTMFHVSCYMAYGRDGFNTPVRAPSWVPPHPAAGAVCRPGLVHGRIRGRPRGGGPAPKIYPEMGINSPHFGFTVPANNKVLITPTRDSPLWPPYFRQTAAGFPGRAPHRAPAVFFARPGGRAGAGLVACIS